MRGESKQRLPALDGLRAYAALVVIVYHTILLFDHGLIQRVLLKTLWQVDASDIWAKAWLSTFNGAAAVELFFLLSGCVLVRSLDTAKGTWLSVSAAFAIKRALRIYPGLIPCVAVTAAVTPSALTWGNIAGNMALWNFDVVGPSWTLQVEMLAIPLLLIVSMVHRSWGVRGVVVALIVALVARKNQEMFVAPLLGQYGYLFILGALVPSRVGSLTASLARPVGWIPVVVAFVFLRQCLGGMDLPTAALGFVLLALLYHDDKAAKAPVLISRVPQFLGKMSFGIYLWNVPFLHMPYLLPQGAVVSRCRNGGAHLCRGHRSREYFARHAQLSVPRSAWHCARNASDKPLGFWLASSLSAGSGKLMCLKIAGRRAARSNFRKVSG